MDGVTQYCSTTVEIVANPSVEPTARTMYRCRTSFAVLFLNSAPHLIHYRRFGIIKEVRVCDTCVKKLVRQRTGYVSPRRDPKKTKTRLSGMPSYGIIKSAHVDVYDNTFDELLYLGSLRMGSRSLATRNLNANIAIWKERWLMLTHAELLCFKPTEGSDLGEVKSSVHMTDILHLEIHEQYQNVLSIIRSDGRIFRLKAKTKDECREWHGALDNARSLFQKAMQTLERGLRDEDNTIQYLSVQLSSEMDDKILFKKPKLGQELQVSLCPGAQIHIGVTGPSCDFTIAAVSYDTLMDAATLEEFGVVTSLSDDAGADVVPLEVFLKAERLTKSPSNGYLAAVAVLLLGIMGQYLTTWKPVVLSVVSCLIAVICLVLYLDQKHHLSLLYSTLQPFRITLTRVSTASSVPSEANEDEIQDEDIDIRYVEGCRGDMVDARRRYVRTMKWRRQNDIDSILIKPQEFFYRMKESYQQAIHKRDKAGHWISIEIAGHLKQSMKDFKDRGVSQEDAVKHHVFQAEFMWKISDTREYPDGQMLTIVDLNGITLSDISKDVVAFIKKIGAAVGDNNPERLWKVFIVNPPSWFNILWKVISPLINPKTRDKVRDR